MGALVPASHTPEPLALSFKDPFIDGRDMAPS
jgi:hypothetical protein